MKNMKKSYNGSKNSKFKPGFKKREQKCIVTFDDADRQEYLTGFHKRKVERKKAAVAELQKKIKEEQKKVKEERHRTYMQMYKERTEALEEDKDDLEEAIITTTESVQYDHPNHTVTVTTINDLDLTGPGSLFLGPAGANQVDGENEDEKKEGGEEEVQERMVAMPKKANNPILNKKIRSLTAALGSHTKSKKRKGKPKQESKREQREAQRSGTTADKKHAGEHTKTRPGRTTKKERRRRQGNRRYQD